MTITVDSINVLADAPAGSTSPDSITYGDGNHIWVAYTNGADSTGAFGDSTIVEYTKSGHAIDTYTLPGYVDGLKIDPYTGDVWALQNQDGNSTLTLIQHGNGHLDGPLSYSVVSSAMGYDDVVFEGSNVFMSRTNPAVDGDATVVELTGSGTPTSPISWTSILAFGDTGYDLVTQATETIPQTDPDSLKSAPNGDLLLSGGDDGTIIDIHNPGLASQSVTFTPIQPYNGIAAHGLDDVIQPSATSGTFYIADTADNRVLVFHVSGLNTADYYASVGSFNAFGQVDPITGVFTPILTAANAPGGVFGSPHGITFVPDPPSHVQVVGGAANVVDHGLHLS
jgi:hypothetical protein